nr:alkaline phosphatase D family protein [Brevibacillus nitrificans]
MDRRGFLLASSKVAALSLGLTLAGTLKGEQVLAAEPKFKAYPFTLGVASGDPLPDGVVLWTRLAPDPLNGGGMPHHDVPVRWEVATDEKFRNVVRRGVEFARAELAHSVHVEVEGLQPDRVYYYQFKAGSEISPVGRTKTLPAFHADVAKLSFAFASCQHYEEGYFSAYRHLAKEDLDLVFHLGDYIYEYGASDGKVRRHNSPEIITLADYRNRHALYRSDSDLQAAHTAFPWVVVNDDHEVENNYAGLVPEKDQPLEPFVARRAAAYQAYYEHMPLRRSSIPNGPNIQLYRRFSYGNLAQFHVLDTRQYRDDQANGDGTKPPTPESTDPKRTLTGTKQEKWLLDGLENSKARWDVLAQQVFFCKRDFKAGAEESYSMDAWDGYAANRDRILDFAAKNDISNLVVLTGDVHSNWANEILADFNNPESARLGVEFVGTSITSGGDGADMNSSDRTVLEENPHIKFVNRQRGYVCCTVTPDQWQADYRVLPYVSRPDAEIFTRVSFQVEHGKPELRKIYDSLVTTS